MMWDTEDSDSDNGIRFKTTSTRNSERNSSSSYASNKHNNRRYHAKEQYNRSDRNSKPDYHKHGGSYGRYRSRSRERHRSRSHDQHTSRSREQHRSKSRDRHRSRSYDRCRSREGKRSRSRERYENKRSCEKGSHSSETRQDNIIFRKDNSKGHANENWHKTKYEITGKEDNIHKAGNIKKENSRNDFQSNDEDLNKTRKCKKSKKERVKVEESISLSESEDEHEQGNSSSPKGFFGPALPPSFFNKINKIQRSDHRSTVNNGNYRSVEYCGPALPPQIKKTENKNNKKIIGPSIQPNINLQSEDVSSDSFKDEDESAHENEDDFYIGPRLIGPNMTTAQLELEKRALELKLAKLDGKVGTSQHKDNVREEWMLELPAVNSLRSLGPVARQFKTKEGPNFSDRSCWTDTPQDKEKKKHQPSEEQIKKSIQERAEKSYEKARDAEQEKMAKKHKKKHKRDESLLEMHRKKLKKQKKQDEKSGKAERRPFSRDVDLKVNKFDQAQTNSIIRKAQLLDTRFSSGKTKYL